MARLLGDWKKLNRRLLQIAKSTEKVTKKIRKRGEKMRVGMRADAPVDTGYLRDHIVKRDIPNGVEVESEAPYSGFLEYGTSRMRPQPFFRHNVRIQWVLLLDELPKEMRK